MFSSMSSLCSPAWVCVCVSNPLDTCVPGFILGTLQSVPPIGLKSLCLVAPQCFSGASAPTPHSLSPRLPLGARALSSPRLPVASPPSGFRIYSFCSPSSPRPEACPMLTPAVTPVSLLSQNCFWQHLAHVLSPGSAGPALALRSSLLSCHFLSTLSHGSCPASCLSLALFCLLGTLLLPVSGHWVLAGRGGVRLGLCSCPSWPLLLPACRRQPYLDVMCLPCPRLATETLCASDPRSFLFFPPPAASFHPPCPVPHPSPRTPPTPPPSVKSLLTKRWVTLPEPSREHADQRCFLLDTGCRSCFFNSPWNLNSKYWICSLFL